MLYKLYKSNRPTVLMTLPVVTLAFWVVGFFHPVQYEAAQHMPLFRLLKWVLFDQIWAEYIVALAALIWSGIFLTNTLNNNEFYQRTTQLPALLYVIFSSCFLSLQGMHPILFAHLFLILAWRRILMIRQQHAILSELFDSGMLIGVAALFYFPAVFIFPVTWITLFILRSFNWREWMTSLIGLILPLLFAVVTLFMIDENYRMYEFIQLKGYQNVHEISENEIVNLTFLSLMGWLTLAGVYHFSSSLMNSVMRGKKLKQIAAFFAALFVGGFVFSAFVSGEEYRFAQLALPLSVLLSYYFFQAKRTWLAALLFYVLLAFIGFNLCLQINLL